MPLVVPKVIDSVWAHSKCPGFAKRTAASSMRHPGSRCSLLLAVLWLPTTQSGPFLNHSETQWPGHRYHQSPALHYSARPGRTPGVWLQPQVGAWAPEPFIATQRRGSGYPGRGRRTPGVWLLPNGSAWAPEPSKAAQHHSWRYPGRGRRTPGVWLLPPGRSRAPEPSIAARHHGFGYPGWGIAGSQ